MSDITANIVVSMPSQLFTLARSFKANANGKIYIGLIDTDPVDPANQIPVYIENEDGSYVQVSQPIVINAGGYPVYNGQISKFVTVKGHSMAVYDQYGVQQFYYPNVLSYDPDQFSQKYQHSVFWTTPQEFGADDTGVSSVNTALTNMFASQYSSFVFPRGTYLLDNTLTTTVTKNISIFLEAGAVIKLANNVRKNMLVFVGNGTNTFEWSGGEIDGNWEGQGPETMTGGNVDDVSHGLVMSKFIDAYVHDLFVHDCMGHHINHGGNKNFTAERITIRSHPSVLKPLGGARGDGITGYSENVTIRDITGYSTDDLIAVFSGIDWVPGWYPNKGSVKKVLIENIRCMVYNFQGVDRYSWNAVSVGNTYGYSTDQVVIRNVVGDTLNGGVMVKAEENGSDYWGPFNTIQIDGVSLCVRGDPANGFTAKMSTPHILIGKNGPNGVSSTQNNTALQVSISNVQMRASSNTLVGIVLGHIQIREVFINNVSCTYDDALQSLHAVMVCGQRDIGNITINNVIQQDNGSSTDSVKGSRSVINSYKNSPGATTLRGSNFSKLLSTSGSNRYVGNTQFNSSDSFARQNMLVFGHEFIISDLDNSSSGGVLGMPFQHGVAFSTPQLGRLTYDQFTACYTLLDYATNWDSTSYGVPNASTFPNFAQFRWAVGTVVACKGSPLSEARGYRASSVTANVPSFIVESNSSYSNSSTLQSSGWNPASTPLTPNVTIRTLIPTSSSDSGFPSTGGAILDTFISSYGSFGGTYQLWQSSSTVGSKSIRLWNGSSWSAWTGY